MLTFCAPHCWLAEAGTHSGGWLLHPRAAAQGWMATRNGERHKRMTQRSAVQDTVAAFAVQQPQAPQLAPPLMQALAGAHLWGWRGNTCSPL